VAAPFYALLRIELFFPDVGSLKAKRAHLNRIKAWLRERLGATVSEVGHQDTWQRATLAAAFAAGSERRCREAVEEVRRTLAEWDPVVEERVVSWTDAEAIG
jgi:uncharacterized protein